MRQLYTDELTQEQEWVAALVNEAAEAEHLLRVLLILLGAVATLAVLAYFVRLHVLRMREMRRMLQHRLKLASKDVFATANTCGSGQYHIFLSRVSRALSTC